MLIGARGHFAQFSHPLWPELWQKFSKLTGSIVLLKAAQHLIDLGGAQQGRDVKGPDLHCAAEIKPNGDGREPTCAELQRHEVARLTGPRFEESFKMPLAMLQAPLELIAG